MKVSISKFFITTTLVCLILSTCTVKCQAPGSMSQQDADTSGNDGLSESNIGSGGPNGANCRKADPNHNHNMDSENTEAQRTQQTAAPTSDLTHHDEATRNHGPFALSANHNQPSQNARMFTNSQNTGSKFY